MSNEVRIRRDGRGTEFGLAHRELPASLCFTDVDAMAGIIDEELSDVAKENETFIECRHHFGQHKFTAIFDLKEPEGLNEAMLWKSGNSVWIQFIISRRLQCRFFIVEAHKKKPPFRFYEVVGENDFRDRGILDYTNEDRKQKINEFWIKLNLLNETEAVKQLSKLHEVEVIYLKNGHYDSRKHQRYEEYDEALRIYKATVKKFRQNETKALICLRSMNGILWSTIKNERL